MAEKDTEAHRGDAAGNTAPLIAQALIALGRVEARLARIEAVLDAVMGMEIPDDQGAAGSASEPGIELGSFRLTSSEDGATLEPRAAKRAE